ncbi:MAG: ABC transporter substrate-binding protein, partial [Candidatus Saccharimonadales bacterium]
MNLQLTLACGAYDRMMALQTGAVRPEGIDLNYLAMGPGDLFRRQARHAEFDVSEFTLSTWSILCSRGDERMVAIPVFPSRKFRHADIYINTHAGIERAEDLKGKRLGTQEYQQTAAVWIRGMLQHEHGVDDADVTWYFGGYNTPEHFTERIPLQLPPRVRSQTIADSQSLDQLLDSGEIDALIGATQPKSFVQRSPHVARLYPDNQQVEATYYQKSGIFPIMHTVVIKRDIYQRHPWIAMNLYEAFDKAKAAGLTRLRESGTLFCALPWLMQ